MKKHLLSLLLGIVLTQPVVAQVIKTPVGVTGTATAGVHGTTANSLNCTVQCSGIFFNFLTDAGGTCNGVVDDGPAFSQAGVLMRAAQLAHPGAPVILTIPPGVTCQWQTCPAGSDGFGPFVGLTQFTFIATGVTMDIIPGCTKYSGDIPGANGVGSVVQKKFLPNSVGDFCVTMVNAGDEANYPVGQWVLVAGQGMQVNSYPPNFAFWEYQQIATTGGGKACFNTPLKNVYVDNTHVVELFPGIAGQNANCSNVTCGGQGTLILMNPTWGSYFHFIGGNWFSTNELEWPEQIVIIDNMIVTSGGNNQNCYTPSLTQKVTINNSNWNGVGNCTSEMDKEVDQIIVNNSTINGNFQSSSINTLTLNNSTYGGNAGFPITTNCNNSTIGSSGGSPMRFGWAFGNQTTFFNGNNCTLVDIDITNTVFNAVQVLPSTGSSGQYTYDGAGHIKSTNNDIYGGNPFYPTWIARGGRMFFCCSASASAVDYNNTMTVGDSQFSPLGSTTGTLTVNISFGGASLPPPNSGTLSWNVMSLPVITCTGCVGIATFAGNGRMAADLNNAGAQSQQLATYSKRTYTCVNNIPNVAGSYDINTTDRLIMAGFLTSLKVNVTVADTNASDAGGATISAAAPIFNTSTGLDVGFQPTYAKVDLLHTGLRTVNLTTSSGSTGADVLSPPGANTFVTGVFNNTVTFSLTGVTNGPAGQCPVVSVEWITSN